jgi:beta-lactamase regulating signal transducer with metallopeptidase domain
MVEIMVYSVLQGTLLGLLVYVVLRLIPRKNSGTRFTVWFSTLLAVVIVPLLSLPSLKAGAISVAGSALQHGLFTLPASLATWAFLAWTLIALAGLLRVAVGFWQALRLRKSCIPIDPANLSPEAQEIVERFRNSRPVLIGTSSLLDVPTAVGFWKPAVLLPAWLVAEVSADELKHVLLHELSHLRRRDDWTNLVQKVVKALLFFHPLVWWIENRLSLERELACDDAVLAQTENPRVYAQCLARLAEKSYLRRQIALAQAAVSRMHQLSNRVTQILDAQRPKTTQLWKPAIPLVAGFALLCGVCLRQAPMLVSFTEAADHPTVTAALTSTTPISTMPVTMKTAPDMSEPGVPQGMGAQLINTGFKLGNNQQHSISHKAVKHLRGTNPIRTDHAPQQPATLRLASYSGYVITHEEFVVTMTSQGIQPGQWQVQVWQLRVLVPASETEKPTPRKI